MTHAWWSDARERQPIVEPRGSPVAELSADGGMNRREDLQHDEQGANDR